MKAPAKPETKTRRPFVPEEAAYLDLVRTTEMLSRPLTQLLKGEDLSAAQYNVLRILRGCPEGLTCGDIANRMVTRDPDITRLLDRMEKRSLISRSRNDKDRRVVLTQITEEGLHLLNRLDQPVRDAHRRLLGHLGAEKLRNLRELLQLCRDQPA